MKKTTSVLLCALTFVLFSCNKDNEKVATPEEAKTSVTTLATDMETDLVEMVNVEGTEALTDLLDLVTISDPFTARMDVADTRREAMKQRLQSFKAVFVPAAARTSGEEPFNFEANLGVYDYNFTTEDFDLTTKGGDKITLNFPTAGSTTNNATLNLNAYAEVEVFGNYGLEYYPTELDADLSVDDAVVATLDLSASYDEEGFPLTADIALGLTPFDYVLSFSDVAETSSSVKFSASKASDKIIGIELNVTFASAEKDFPQKLDGEVSYRAFALRGDIDLTKAQDSTDGTLDINDLINVSLYDGNTKVGDIVFEESNGEMLMYVQYSDGSKELFEELMKPVIDEMENFLMELEGAA